MKTRVTVTIDDSLLMLARRHAKARDESLSQLLEALVDEHLDKDVVLKVPLAPPCLEQEWLEARANRLAKRFQR